MPAGAHPSMLAHPTPAPILMSEEEVGFGLPVYWPGDHHHKIMVDMVDYIFEPRSVKYIYATRIHERDDKGKIQYDLPTKVKLQPDVIVKALLDNTKGGRVAGLRALSGQFDRDELIKRDARKAYVPWRMVECDAIIADHERSCSAARNRDMLPPRPSAAWRLAKHDRANLDTSFEDRKRFVCSRDGMDFDTLGEFHQYVAREYPGIDPATVLHDSRPLDPKPEAPPAPVAAPAGVAPVDFAIVAPKDASALSILLRAGEEGITLRSEIRRDLKSNDPALVAAAIKEALEILDGPQG